MARVIEKGLYCKKCGKPMYLVMESEELSNGAKRVTQYYKCLVCGYRVDTEYIRISREKDVVVVRRRKRILKNLFSS